MKILIIIGTRPEAIKMVALIDKFKKDKFFNFKLCITGQHKEMLNQVLKDFNIKPDFNLKLMTSDQTLFSITSGTLYGLEKIFNKFLPDIVLVHGDTISSFAASLASYFKKLPIGHVEAGLRTNNIYSPWPEEGSRKLTDALSTIHFAPTSFAKENLIKEGYKKNSIHITGNTVIDSLFFAKKFISEKKSILRNLEKKYSIIDNNKLILVTAHRRENFGKSFDNICKALIKISKKNKNIVIIYPLHPNPNIKVPAIRHLSKIKNIFLVDPLDYFSFVYLMSKSYLILTDSGGIQEEAPSIHKPVLVMRDETERQEATMTGTIKLVGTNTKKIFDNVQLLINNKKVYNSFIVKKNPYGNGTASSKILKILKSKYSFLKNEQLI